MHEANLAREPFTHTLLCDCGYSEPTTDDPTVENTFKAIREYMTTVAD